MISAVKKILLLLIPFVFFSCGMTVEDASFTAKLDTIDKLIFQSQYTDAQKILKSIEGKSYTAFQYIAISKRYINMKNFESAEKILAKAYKKHPTFNKFIIFVGCLYFFNYFLLFQNLVTLHTFFHINLVHVQ